ncbi:MAG: DUF885 domain-containing protein [Coprothermobacterota bacterium]|nr:DUF885 domain-containing protein [Coprothermobacterota bacterium]
MKRMFSAWQGIVFALTLLCLLSGCGSGITPSSSLPPPSTSSSFPSPTPSSTSQTTTLAEGLEGLPFDAFLEESYHRLLLRDPELVTQLGMGESWGVNGRLTDISEAYQRQTQSLEKATLDLLKRYDPATLDQGQRLNAEIYSWTLEDIVARHPYLLCDYPVNPSSVFSIPSSLQRFLTDLQQVGTVAQAADCLACLSQVPTKFSQLAEGLAKRKEGGAVLPSFLFSPVLAELRGIAETPARSTPFFTSFAGKVNKLVDLNQAGKDALLLEAAEVIEGKVLPAYRSLLKTLGELQAAAPQQAGCWTLPGGEAYYKALLRHYTTTDLDAETIHQMGKTELVRIQGEIRSIFEKLGYNSQQSIPELYARLQRETGTLVGEPLRQAYQAIIEEAQGKLASFFHLLPRAKVEVVGGPSGGFYVPPALDGSRPGLFYASTIYPVARYGMKTLTYHETIPGHHFQIALTQEMPLPSFRQGADFDYPGSWVSIRMTWLVIWAGCRPRPSEPLAWLPIPA